MSLAMKARQKVKKKIVKDKVFGCDLMEHLQLSGQEVPQVLKSCTEFVEEHGIVDGIYRLCGISSNVQKLRQEFDLERPPDLNKSLYLQDVHCVSSLCKAYFRELPNPLLTYQLYDKFADAVAIQLEEQRLIKIRDVLKELPLPHYRTLEYLMKHLIHVASFSSQTNMHTRNLAIVWAPNLLRSKDIESSGFNGTAAFMEVRVQSIVVEFILTHVEQLFGNADGNMNSTSSMVWPTCVPEDYFRSLSYNLPSMLNHGDGPPQIRPYHTIIEFSDPKRKGSLKAKKWKSIFNLGRSNNDSKRKSTKQDDKDENSDKMNLRPAKSMDSLSSVPYTAEANDLDQRGLTRKSAKRQVPLRRESLGSESKKDNAGFELSDASEQAQAVETNNGDYEEEGQAKSEPTTPKPGRASMVTTPQGRSPKTNRNRAEKCVGVHISGPFSVTLPFHITSNLSRLTRGMECPSLNYSVLHKSSERLFHPEGHLYMGSSDTDKVRLTMVSHIDKERSQPIESTVKEIEQKTETNRMSLEVQDTFSFLDSQDSNPDETKTVCKAEEEKPTERIAEYAADSEILQYDLQHDIQMEEFSVEPPQDDPCTEDESDQMYFTPAGCLDDDPLQDWHDSLEDVYLSAYDDLSPLYEETNDHSELHKQGEIEQTKTLTEKEENDKTTGSPIPTTDGQKEALCDTQKASSQPDMVDESNSQKNDDKCDVFNSTIPEVICSRKESNCCTQKDEIVYVQDGKTVRESVENSSSGDVIPGDIYEDQDRVESEIPVETICTKDNAPESEAMLFNLCSPNVLISHSSDKDIPLVDTFNSETLGSPEQQETDLYNETVLLIIQPTAMKLDLPEVQNTQYDDENVPLVHTDTLKNLESSKQYDIENSEIVQVGLECAEDLEVVEDIMAPKTIKNTEESRFCPSDSSVLENPHRITENRINMAEIILTDIFPLPNCLDTPEDQALEKQESSLKEHASINGNQLQDTEISQGDLCSEMIQSDYLPTTLEANIIQGQNIDHYGSSELKSQDSQICSSNDNKLSDPTKCPITSRNTGVSSINPDGSVTMKLAFTTNRVHQVKSVPVVPPKPQFAKLPPALKSKLHTSSILSTSKDNTKSPKPGEAACSQSTEAGSDCTPKRRSSWRNATSVSFDTAMTLAKERQQSQTPVRRMQTYCLGDSSDVLDSKIENIPSFPKFTIKAASSRTHRPLSCMSLSSVEAEFRGNTFLQQDPNSSIHGAQSLFQQEAEAYTKELPQRNRLSMPRLGRQSSDDVHIQTSCHQRRSLL
ncbi:rho GTPase-activating protein 30 [Pyxicephalus adspersus]|uniref:rho GTPase-activating protein 30 n=1 Tax=Pyxicephalus adspersus TaxID=30357 RepID=UPI003B5B281E